MKRLVQGSIVEIPLLKGLGFAYAKYINLTKLDQDVSFPDLIKVFRVRTKEQSNNILERLKNNYLVNPILVAGLRPTIKKGQWNIIGKLPLEQIDEEIPDFKLSNAFDHGIKQGVYYKCKKASAPQKTLSTYEETKYLQYCAGSGTGNVEIRLTMYFLILEDKRVEDYFDLDNESNRWHYDMVLDAPVLP